LLHSSCVVYIDDRCQGENLYTKGRIGQIAYPDEHVLIRNMDR
jgi:hypothetical protein